jgi:hypothetical protein
MSLVKTRVYTIVGVTHMVSKQAFINCVKETMSPPITKIVYVELPKVIKLSKLNDYNSTSRTIEELLMKKYIIRTWPLPKEARYVTYTLNFKKAIIIPSLWKRGALESHKLQLASFKSIKYFITQRCSNLGCFSFIYLFICLFNSKVPSRYSMAYQVILFNRNGTHFNIMVCLVLYLQVINGTSLFILENKPKFNFLEFQQLRNKFRITPNFGYKFPPPPPPPPPPPN